MYLQRTVKKEVGAAGIGLHTGRKINMTIKPAGVDAGIVFLRRDLSKNNIIKAELNNVLDTHLATTIGINGTRISTVEHLLSAFSGMGLDNAVVEVDAPEIPIMDGSALPFVNLLKNVGTKVQGKGKRLLLIKKAISVSDGDGKAMFLPSPEFKITYKIDFQHPLIGEQSYHIAFSDAAYEKDICAARTFGFLKDVEYLQAKGLALGGSLKNAVILTEKKIVNKDGLRFPDEFVKHKILDAIGDLSLLGMPIIGHFVAHKSGHKLNNLLLKELLLHEECWSIAGSFNRKRVTEESTPLNVPYFGLLDSVRVC
ncbi:MAG: UDP-3-O-acyl-N-acetylglucosamine deacetylase [Syntrophales bacterium]|nr:UDP-3-O-acyl-N-acetylglucosamine deacetylase [Syntrophales bacterium]